MAVFFLRRAEHGQSFGTFRGIFGPFYFYVFLHSTLPPALHLARFERTFLFRMESRSISRLTRFRYGVHQHAAVDQHARCQALHGCCSLCANFCHFDVHRFDQR